MGCQTHLDSVRDAGTRARVFGARPHTNVTVTDLLDKLTAAKQGSRELDVAIGEFLGEIPSTLDGWIAVETISKVVEGVPSEIGTYLRLDTFGEVFRNKFAQRKKLPEWSSSVDAALSVKSRLPSDFRITLTENDDGSYSAVVGRRREFVTSNTSWGGSAPTISLAIMIAIVRAMGAVP